MCKMCHTTSVCIKCGARTQRRRNTEMVAASSKTSCKIVQPFTHIEHNALPAIQPVNEVLQNQIDDL